MFSAAYRTGLERGRQIALRLSKSIGGIRSLGWALAEEMDLRQDTLTMEFIKKMNAGDNSPGLWNTYESGTRDGIRQIMESGK